MKETNTQLFWGTKKLNLSTRKANLFQATARCLRRLCVH